MPWGYNLLGNQLRSRKGYGGPPGRGSTTTPDRAHLIPADWLTSP